MIHAGFLWWWNQKEADCEFHSSFCRLAMLLLLWSNVFCRGNVCGNVQSETRKGRLVLKFVNVQTWTVCRSEIIVCWPVLWQLDPRRNPPPDWLVCIFLTDNRFGRAQFTLDRRSWKPWKINQQAALFHGHCSSSLLQVPDLSSYSDFPQWWTVLWNYKLK